MKLLKIIKSWFAKGSKIERVLKQIYNGLFVVTRALNSVLESMSEITDENMKNKAVVVSTIETVLVYSDEAMRALQKILDWFGMNPKLDPTSLSLETKLPSEQTFCAGFLSPASRLSDITSAISKEMFEDKRS